MRSFHITSFAPLIIFVLSSCGTAPGTSSLSSNIDDYDFLDHITFSDINTTTRPCDENRYGTYYCDVMTHTRSPYMGSDTLTNVHETQHFMAHEVDSQTPEADKFIYWTDGQGTRFPEPATLTSGIYSSIKERGVLYNTYIGGRPSQPLGENIVDEWRAYLTEEIVAIEMAHIQGQTSGVSGLTLGGVEFLYYNAAALHALATNEPAALENPQIPAIFAMLAEDVNTWTIKLGVDVDLFQPWSNDRAKDLLDKFRRGEQHAAMRATLTNLYGSAWTSRVLGF